MKRDYLCRFISSPTRYDGLNEHTITKTSGCCLLVVAHLRTKDAPTVLTDWRLLQHLVISRNV
jgi:hypothetical protein